MRGTFPRLVSALGAVGLGMAVGVGCMRGASTQPHPKSAASGSALPDSAAPAGRSSETRPSQSAGGRTAVKSSPPTVAVSPLPGWPRWLGDANHQISGLAFRDGRLYAVPDQSGAERGALLEIDPGPSGRPSDSLGAERDVVSSPDPPPRSRSDSDVSGDGEHGSARRVEVRVLCRWHGGSHPDAEGLALDPWSGPPRVALIPLESQADTLLEIGVAGCDRIAEHGPLTGRNGNEGIEGVALSPDGRTVFLVHETERTLLVLPRGSSAPARVVARIRDASSLCDAAYDDRGSSSTDDDRLLLLDRNARRIFSVTLSGEVAGRWDLDRPAVATDPDGFAYSLVALEALAIESREPDGSLLVFAATDPPPRPFPYHRKQGKDPQRLYERRVGMLYRFRLPPLGGDPGP